MISLRSIAAAGLCIAAAACSRSGPPSAAQGGSSATQGGSTAAPGGPSTTAAGPAAGAELATTSPDGVRIAYHVYGHGDPAVVLIHGWACDSSYWRAQLADLASKYTTVTLDLAGHGASGRNRTDWSMANYGRDVAAVVQRLPNRRIVLVGHLMGGPVALEAAPLLGDRLIGVIGVDTFTSLGRPLPTRQALDAQIAPFRADFVGYMHRFVPQLFAKSADPAFVRQVADDMSREPPQIAIASLISLNTLDFGTLLPQIHVPIVAIDSDLGHTPAPDEARIRKIYPAFRAVMLPNPGHFLMLEDPRRFNPVLLQEITFLVAPRPDRGSVPKELGAQDGSRPTRSPAS